MRFVAISLPNPELHLSQFYRCLIKSFASVSGNYYIYCRCLEHCTNN